MVQARETAKAASLVLRYAPPSVRVQIFDERVHFSERVNAGLASFYERFLRQLCSRLDIRPRLPVEIMQAYYLRLYFIEQGYVMLQTPGFEL
jgi:hypothetical protein